MKIIICGAGQVGSNIASYLAAENNNVTVIDHKADLTQRLSDRLDVRTVIGHASNPTILEQAGAEDAEMLVAVTQSDEVNMVACQVAHSLFSVPTKVARIRNQAYLESRFSDLFTRDNLPIDVVISPEIEVARAIRRRLDVPGAFDMFSVADDMVRVVGVICTERCPIIHTPLRQLTGLFPDLNIEIVAIIRGERKIIPDSNDRMLPGDEVYFVADSRHMQRAMSAFGHEEQAARRIVVVGGGNVGLFLGRELEANISGVSVRIVEGNKERAEFVAGQLDKAIVLNGDGLDEEILREANVAGAETTVAVTNDDQVNILVSLLAKRSNCPHAITLLNKTDYTALVSALGIDAVVNPRSITASTVLQHVRRGRIKSVHSLRDGFAEIIEAEALETSSLLNVPLKDVRLPPGVLIGAIVRGDEVIIGRPNAVIKPHDRVILLSAAQSVRKIEKLFAVRLEFF
ncbi:MAG: Trk system potassium transporter TrkA [Rhodospirillaceae bacterium]|nr:Trk system potassium transporter TrkA [Rhodospirillaceae bacterium]MCA8932187.1 Trk system potassium transporter TrkA [Rhodospirillaceae bacterium]